MARFSQILVATVFAVVLSSLNAASVSALATPARSVDVVPKAVEPVLRKREPVAKYKFKRNVGVGKRQCSTTPPAPTSTDPPPPPPSTTDTPPPPPTTTSDPPPPPPPTSTEPPPPPPPTSTDPPPPPPPTSTQPPPPPTQTQQARKVGLAWSIPNGAPDSAVAQWNSASVGGLYTWSPDCPSTAAAAGIPCIPMLWGDKQIPQWNVVVQGYATLALGCNEVDNAGQSAMDVNHGADLWRQYLAPLKSQGYSLGSHSVTNAPTGLQWLQSYSTACPDCWASTDYVVLHYYGTNVTDFINYITTMHTTLGKDIMVTEFDCNDFSGQTTCSQDDINNFVQQATAFMESQDWVHMYFWFGLFTQSSWPSGVNPLNGMMNDDGSPNALGQAYLNPPSS